MEARLEQAKQTVVDLNKTHDSNVRRLETDHDREVASLKQHIQTIGYEATRRADEIQASAGISQARLEKDLELAKRELDHVREALSETSKQLEAQNRKVDSLRTELEKEASQHQRAFELENLTHRQELEKLQSRLEQERTRIAESSEFLDRQAKHLSEEKEALKVENARLAEQNRSHCETISHLKEDLSKVTSTKSELELKMSFEKNQSVQNEAAVARLQETIQDLKQQLGKREAEAAELQKGLQQQTEAASQAKRKRTELEEQLRDLELTSQKDRTRSELLDKQRYNELEDVKNKNKIYEAQITSVQQRLVEMDEHYQMQKRDLSSILDERRHDHDTVIEPLRETVEKQRSELRSLKERCAMMEGQVESQQTQAQAMYKENTELKVLKAQLEVEKEERERRTIELKDALNALRSEATALQQQLVVCDRQKKDLEVERDSCITKLQDCSSKAYDEQLTLNSALQEANKEKASLACKCEALDNENKRIAAELEEMTTKLQKSDAEAVQVEGLRREVDASNSAFEVESLKSAERIADLEGRLNISQMEITRSRDTLTNTVAEMDLLRTALQDKEAEVAELKSANDVLKEACSQQQRENELYVKEREGLVKKGQEAENWKSEARRAERLEVSAQQSMESEEELKSSVVELNAVINEDRKRIDGLLKELREKEEAKAKVEREARASRERYEGEVRELKATRSSVVNLLATVLGKLHDYVTDASGYIRHTPHADDTILTTVSATTAAWRADPSTFNPTVAQSLSTKLMSLINRSLDTLKHLHTAAARSSRGSPTPAQQ
eukprot:TRINITY_DN5353_c0_g1_i1.p1 TRINITY_DN5353_c0_g1~~TRINITY_DN5353_c0_g1_i1.p1  ORF type:complete len:793 (+),score=322.87 TRINITY_DN5353_c0_g1_i1:1777-4155(+)